MKVEQYLQQPCHERLYTTGKLTSTQLMTSLLAQASTVELQSQKGLNNINTTSTSSSTTAVMTSSSTSPHITLTRPESEHKRAPHLTDEVS